MTTEGLPFDRWHLSKKYVWESVFTFKYDAFAHEPERGCCHTRLRCNFVCLFTRSRVDV